MKRQRLKPGIVYRVSSYPSVQQVENFGPAIESTREIENKRETGVRAWSAPIVCEKKIEFCEICLVVGALLFRHADIAA